MPRLDSPQRATALPSELATEPAASTPDQGSLIVRLDAFRHPRGKAKALASTVALLSLGALVTYAARSFPPTPGVRWGLLVAIGSLGPTVTIWVNAKEFQLQARILGQTVASYDAVRVSVLGTAANLLPLPGALMVRTQALAVEAGLKRSAGVGAATGIVWLAVSLGLSGVGLSTFGRSGLGAAAMLVGAILLGAGLAIGRALGADRRTLGLLAVTEAALAATGALRLYFILLALSVDVSPAQAVSLAASSAVASAAGVFPAGVGIREALSGFLASMVDLPAAVGVAAAAIDRLSGLAVLFVSVAVILLLDARSTHRRGL